MWKNLFSKKDDKPKQWEYDDICTPNTDDESIKLATESLNNMYHKLTSNEGWDFMSQIEDIVLEQHDSSDSRCVCVRASVTIHDNNIDIDRLTKDLFNPSFESRKIIYNELLLHQDLKKINSDTILSYSQYKSPMMVTDRDFLCLWSRKKLDNGWVFSVESINSEEKPFLSNFVRGTTSSGALLELESDVVKFIIIEQINPRGSIPSMVTNMLKGKIGERVKLIKIHYAKN
jgi:hypothetical protein